MIVLTGAPCSGKSTAAAALQARALANGSTWMYVPLDAFDAVLPAGKEPVGDAMIWLQDTSTAISTPASRSHVVLEVGARTDNW